MNNSPIPSHVYQDMQRFAWSYVQSGIKPPGVNLQGEHLYNYALVLMAKAYDLGLPYRMWDSVFSNIKGRITLNAAAINSLLNQAGHRIWVAQEQVVPGDDQSFITVAAEKHYPNGTQTQFTCTVTLTDLRNENGGKLKDTVQSYPRDMMYASAVRRLGRRYFPEIINGFYETYELADALDEPVETPQPAQFQAQYGPPLAPTIPQSVSAQFQSLIEECARYDPQTSTQWATMLTSQFGTLEQLDQAPPEQVAPLIRQLTEIIQQYRNQQVDNPV